MRSTEKVHEGSRTEMKKETMGTLIAAKRRELGMTQLELAEKMGVTDKAVSKWERDLSCPDVNSLPKLAEVFGISLDELMQIKTESVDREKSAVSDIVSLVLKAVCLAMGVAVTVISAVGEIETKSAIMMLGIGVACAGISLLNKQ